MDTLGDSYILIPQDFGMIPIKANQDFPLHDKMYHLTPIT